MANVKKATHVANLNTTEDDLTKELFGENVKEEIDKAIIALKDFKEFIPKIKRDYKMLERRIKSCTKKDKHQR